MAGLERGRLTFFVTVKIYQVYSTLLTGHAETIGMDSQSVDPRGAIC